MAELPKILVFGGGDQAASLSAQLEGSFRVAEAQGIEDVLEQLRDHSLAGVCFLGEALGNQSATALLMEAGGILSQIPEGLTILDPALGVLWANSRFVTLTGTDDSPLGRKFYDTFGTPEILGPDFCPFHTALGSKSAAQSLLRISDKVYYQIEVTPVFQTDALTPSSFVVLIRDVSDEILQQQKLNAIYQAGLELGDLSPQELAEMSVQDRIELLKSKIVHFTQDLLRFETVEIRLLDRTTGKLDPLLVVGMGPVAAGRELYAKPQDNGVTGFVAATGKSYLCEDTGSDPLYLPGAPDARSSLTVPLFLHDEILGTFNVESTTVGAFTENDLHFLELFSREVAVALNTLELLVAEKMTTCNESIEMILREVAKPVDEVLNEATWILERYIGHEPNVAERLQSILAHTRDIKQLIQTVGETISPKVVHSPLPPRPQRPKLRKKRVLVADSDAEVRRAAHELLGRFGCEVETARSGEEALLMVRRFDYDAVLADIRLPDMSGYDCFCQVRDIRNGMPVILMTGFGYDPGHSIVKARQQGLKSVLYKPFRLDQLLEEVEKAVSEAGVATTGPSPAS